MSCEGRKHILNIEGLNITFSQYEKGMRKIDLPVIKDLDVYVHEGEVVAVVGASGSGKSLLAHAVLGILPANASWGGLIEYDEEKLTEERLEKLRGKEIVLIPQSVNYLDPLMRVGDQVRKGKRDKSVVSSQRAAFKRYGLKEEAENLYPFELSGGMARRVLVSAATIETPKLIIADEPTPGMHEDAAKETINHLREFADKGAGVLLITHDLELALMAADRIAVFYAGTTVEEAPAEDFKQEETLRHPYTKALWRALPQNGFHPILGNQPYVKDFPDGCPFAPRCSQVSDKCGGKIESRLVRCGTVRCVKAV